MTRVFGYVRVSAAAQVTSGLGLAAQRRLIQDAARRVRGGRLVEIVEDRGVSARRCLLSLRPGGQRLNALLAAGDMLIVAKMDRAFRRLADFAALMDDWRRRGVRVQILDVGVDTSTPVGEMVCGIMAAVAQWESRRIGERIRDAFVETRRRGRTANGQAILGHRLVRGKLRADAEELAAMRAVARLRDQGMTWPAIAAELQRRGRRPCRGPGSPGTPSTAGGWERGGP